MKTTNYICWFSEDRAANPELVGDKGAELNRLERTGYPLPPGFCITVAAYSYLLKMTGLDMPIIRLLQETNFEDQQNAAAQALAIRELIEEQPIPREIASEVLEHYIKLGRLMGYRHLEAMPVAIRPSVTVEEAPDIYLSDQLETYLNVRGGYAVLKHARRCWASFWNYRSLNHLRQLGIDYSKVKIAVVVQAMTLPESYPVLSNAHTFA